jgi:hypothetical protein
MKFADYKKVLSLDMNRVINHVLKYQDVKDYAIYLNQERQLNDGLDAKGQWIETISSNEQGGSYPYSKYTVQLKQDKGQQYDAVNLKDTGDFWQSMNVKVNEDSFEILAEFTKGGDDIRNNFALKYDFLGLMPESLDEFGTWLLQNYLKDYIRESLKLS